MQTLAESLVEQGHQSIVVTTQPAGAAVDGEINGVKIYYLPVRNVYRPFSAVRPGTFRKAIWHAVDSYNPLMSRAVGRIIDAERPDVVNSHNLAGFSAASFGSGEKLSIARVHTLHDQYLLCPKSVMFKNGRNCVQQCADCRLLASPRRHMTRYVDVLIGVSRFIVERHEQNGFFRCAEKRIIFNALADNSAAVHVPKHASNRLRFGFLGQLRATKGLHRLIDAFLSECAEDSELWIAGRGDDAYESEQRARTVGVPTVRWLGFVRPEEFLSAIDILVVPSLWNDTAPLVLIEAFAAAVPVVASNRGGIPEFLGTDRGWLVNPDDLSAFGKTLRHCITSRAKLSSMGAAALAYASRFNVKRFVDGYLGAFERSRELVKERTTVAGEARSR